MFKGRVFTKNDYERLCSIMNNVHMIYQLEEGSVETLKREMRQSRLVDPRDIRPNIVTMNSRICLKNIGNGRKEIFSLVFPEKSDSEDSLSVFSRIGTQVIGNPIGTVVKVNHSGEQYLMIEDILYQPESAGDYHL
ncbi:MAG: transcription elongation factor GreAB [Chrysiogenales bacterium]|nr:MAG: transcription elongation factor GreAB [Chrysiogenales bacterium]